MNCLEFERWLDEGDALHASGAALVHAAECARCARALAHARALEAALEQHFAGAPVEPSADFAARVLTRIAAVDSRRAHAPMLADTLPWWVRAASEPSMVAAAALVALLLWRGETLIALTRTALTRLATMPTGPAPAWSAFTSGLSPVLSAFDPVPGAGWPVAIAVAVGLAPVVGLASYGLWRVVDRLVGGASLVVTGRR